MRTKLLLIVFLFGYVSFSQNYIIQNEMITDFVSTVKSKIKYSDATLNSKMDADNFFEFTIEYGGESKPFKLKPLTYPLFQSKFKSAFSEILSETDDKDGNKLTLNDSINSKVDNKIALLFTQIITYYNTEEERPQVATIYLKDNINVYYFEKEKEKDFDKIGVLTKVSVEISFYAGFIEKLQVNGEINGNPVSFNNKFSIGISSTKNIRQLSNNRLYTNEQFSKTFIENNIKTNEPQINKLSDRNSLFISVGDVIRYVKKVDVNANDISPIPQLVLLDENQKISKLYKEESTKLFEAVVYTDFFGVFDDENPNGIIQTEITKRFNIETQRFDMTKKGFSFLFPPLYLAEGVGLLQFFDAHFQYSKIEKNNKFLLPSTFDIKDDNGNTISTEKYYSPLSLFQLRNFAIGGYLNALTIENQNAKLNVYFNLGFLFGRSGIKETIDQPDGTFINNLEIPIECKFHLLPEKRVSFEFGSRLSWFELFNEKINLKSIENDKLVSKNNWLNSFNLNLNVDVSTTGRLFLRYKLIHELDNIKNNFSQLQFGYSFYLLQNNGAKKLKK